MSIDLRSAFGKTWKMCVDSEILLEGEEAIGLLKRARACLEKSVDLGRRGAEGGTGGV